MTITVELPEDLAGRLASVGIPAEEVSRYAVATLLEIARRVEADAAEARAWWEGLTDQQRLQERETTAKTILDSDNGRTRPAADVYARIRASHNSSAR